MIDEYLSLEKVLLHREKIVTYRKLTNDYVITGKYPLYTITRARGTQTNKL